MTHWSASTQDELEQAVQEQVDAGEIETTTSRSPKPSLLGSILLTFAARSC